MIAHVRRALRARRHHELPLRPRERVRARDAPEDRDRHDADREDHHLDPRSVRRRLPAAGLGRRKHRNEREREHELRERKEDVEERAERSVGAGSRR